MSLEVRNLTKTYGDFSLRIDLSVEEGETLVLVGPSGCGKTSALNLIAGIMEADGGTVLINGEDISDLPAWKRNISVVFQDLALFPHLNVGNNIAYGLFIKGVPKAERRRIVEENLRMIRLPGYEKRRIQTLSGGERQRVAIARAMAASPRILLLDEPFSSLDAPLRREIREEFLHIRSHSRAPCIFVTHDREEAAVLGSRVALLSEGGIVEINRTRDIFLKPETEQGARFFGMGTILDCSIVNTGPAGTTVHSGIGTFTVPPGSAFSPERPLLFIPKDALSLDYPATAGKGDRLSIDAYFRSASFEGERLTWRLSPTRLNEEGKIPQHLTLEPGLRKEEPPAGSPVRCLIDRSLVRFIVSSTEKPGK
ncbi:MAG: ABC transporter ATP-binding protein [Treponema sp.]|jgi:ABC-type Fe3+/spermidine/putrescine transport system ATPase subunit|nr:ABC transporter ATP-binding protein [Treponema sp.]